MSGSEPSVAGEVNTPEEPRQEKGQEAEIPPQAPRRNLFGNHDGGEEEDVFEDASEDGEVQFRRDAVGRRPPHRQEQPLNPFGQVSGIRPEHYDGTTAWPEYQVYFDQLSELNNWDEERKAMVLGVCLKGEARMVLASLSPAQRHSYVAVTVALSQSFAPKELVHLHQAELKARKKKGDESMADLGRDVARLVRLAYPTADAATREIVGINSFLDALPGPALEMKLHVIKGRPRTLQEAVAHATEVDAVMAADSRRIGRRGEVREVTPVVGEEDKLASLERQCAELKRLTEDLKKLRFNDPVQKAPFKDVTCFGCGGKGHLRRDCKKVKEGTSPLNGGGRLSRQ